MKDFAKLLSTGKTVFTIDDIYQIFSLYNKFSLRNIISRFGKQWLLQNIYYWIWALPNYNDYQLANVIEKMSYISLETVLYKEWFIFQNYNNTIFSIATRSRSINIKDKKYVYQKIKKEILLDPIGINHIDGYRIASIERAICDRIYLTPGYYFDNLRNVNWDRVEKIAKIYDNKRMLLDIKKLKDGARY